MLLVSSIMSFCFQNFRVFEMHFLDTAGGRSYVLSYESEVWGLGAWCGLVVKEGRTIDAGSFVVEG
jgi:hypothetical protein